MRPDAARAWEVSDVLLDREGNDCAGDPDPGCEIQSSESESSHACSIATESIELIDCYVAIDTMLFFSTCALFSSIWLYE